MTNPHRNLAVVLKPWRAAISWGIWPTSFFRNLYYKVSINNLQTSVWPEAAAKWSGVHSWLFPGLLFSILFSDSYILQPYGVVLHHCHFLDFFPQDFPTCTGSHEICQTAQQNEVLNHHHHLLDFFWYILSRGTHICSNRKQPDFYQKSSLTPMSQLSPV